MERNENPINLGYFLENISYHIMNNAYFFVFESINIKPNPDIECDELLEDSRKDEKSQKVQSKASVFEYILNILKKKF